MIGYNLTSLGQQYFYQFKTNEGFCFGKLIIDDVEIDGVRNDNWRRSTKWFHFKFHLENIPQWVNDHSDQLDQIYFFDVNNKIHKGIYPMAGQLISTSQGWALDGSYFRMLEGN